MGVSESEKEKQVEQWRGSGQTAREWSQQNKIAYSTFLRWTKKWDAVDGTRPANERTWGEVVKSTDKHLTNESITGRRTERDKEDQKARIIYGRCEIEITEGFSEQGIIKILRAVEAVCC